MVEKAERKKQKKILVTGSAGMLGSELLKELIQSFDVVGLDNRVGQTAVKGKNFQAVICDITDSKDVAGCIRKIKPEIIVHAAAWTDVEACQRDKKKAQAVNVEGTRNIAIPSAEIGVPVIYISTDFVFNGYKKIPYTEEDMPAPLNVYGSTKLAGEKILSSLRNSFVIRTGWLYGPNGRNFADTILIQAREKNELVVVSDQIGCPTYTRDLVKALKCMIDLIFEHNGELDDIRGVYHVSNKGRASWYEYAKTIIKLVNISDVAVNCISSYELKSSVARPEFSILNNSKFEKMTGFSMRPWQEALAEYLRGKEADKRTKAMNLK